MMDATRKQLQNPLVIGIIAFVLGVFIGLVVLGWWLWPVKWTDSVPADLSPAYQVEYMVMAVEAYGQNGDVAKAKERYDALGENAEAVLTEVMQDPTAVDQQLANQFSAAVGSGVMVTPVPGATQPPVAGTEEQPTQETDEKSLFSKLWPVFCLFGLLLFAILIYMFIMRSRQTTAERPATPIMQAQEAARQVDQTDFEAEGVEQPVSQYMASYKIGDDLFDDSFSVDSESGEFLGECGVGISDTIGVGDPKKVTAFEVWLFDKNDIQTITKVVMSDHAFNDSDTRQRLEAKGEPVLSAPGSETVLETQTLQLVARVVDMGYAYDPSLPKESFFDNLIFELAVWQK